MFKVTEYARHGIYAGETSATGSTIRDAVDALASEAESYLTSASGRAHVADGLAYAGLASHGWSDYRLTHLCACGNVVEEGERLCDFCWPCEHEAPARAHDFTVNMLCTDCGLLAQDCCETSGECPGYTAPSERAS